MDYRRESAVTVVGFLLLIGLATLTLCGLVYVGKKALNALQKVQAHHDSAITNELDVAKSMINVGLDPNEPLLIDPPGAIWTDLSNGLWQVEIPDAEFTNALALVRPWAILKSDDLLTWADTGNRVLADPGALAGLLRDLAYYEGHLVGASTHGNSSSGFYRAVPEEDAPPPPDPGK